MIIGYDIACYSYGGGPCVQPTKGYVRTERFDAEDRERIMRNLMREQLHLNSRYPRTTSIIVTFVWGDDERADLHAGLIDHNQPERAPYPYQADAMAAFQKNVWVGTTVPATSITGDI